MALKVVTWRRNNPKHLDLDENLPFSVQNGFNGSLIHIHENH
jgi:hypothetical protein